LAAFARPLMVVVHRFMEPGELQNELGRQRLEACVFKWPVDGEMVSMCEVNATNLMRELSQRGADRLVANHRQINRSAQSSHCSSRFRFAIDR